MSLLSLLGQTATVTPRTQSALDEDEYGDPVLAEGIPGTYPARLEQTSSTENVVGGDLVLTSVILFLPANAIVHHLDQVAVDEQVFEVIGEPNIEVSPAGPHHQIAHLREVLGG